MKILRNFKRFFNKAVKQPGYAFSVLGKRLAAQAYYTFGDGRSSDPEALTLFLTHKCNLHCKMCGQWGDGGVTKKESAQFIQGELPFENVKALIDEVSRSRPNITLFGGEPLLHTRAVDIIKYVKSRGMHCLVITNASLLEGMAEDLAASGLDELNVSLDGDMRLHDEIRGMEGLFRRIMSGLERIKDIKRLNGRKKPLVNLQCTVTRYNQGRLGEMIAVAERAGADSITFHNLIFTDRKTMDEHRPYDEMLGCSSKDWEGFVFEPGIDPKKLSEEMRPILAAKHPFSVDLYPNFSDESLAAYYGDPSFSPGSKCLSPWIAAYIFPDGEVRPCLNSTYSFGNIKSCSFANVWNGQKAVLFRKALRKSGAFPLCRRCTELYRY